MNDDTLREQLVEALETEWLRHANEKITAPPIKQSAALVDALLPLIHEHVADTVTQIHERCEGGREVERTMLRNAMDHIQRARTVCDAVNYKVPGDSDSYGGYPEGRCDLAGEVLAALDGTEAKP